MPNEAPITRASLLIQIRDGANHAAWQEFVGLYGPVIYGFARKRGLQDADAADLMQDVLRSVSSAIGRLDYDRTQGVAAVSLREAAVGRHEGNGLEFFGTKGSMTIARRISGVSGHAAAAGKSDSADQRASDRRAKAFTGEADAVGGSDAAAGRGVT